MVVLNDLRNRGVEDILIACMDGLTGFPDAVRAVFPHTRVQRQTQLIQGRKGNIVFCG
jgi:transposase-like protein